MSAWTVCIRNGDVALIVAGSVTPRVTEIILNLSDRCAMVFAVMLIPVCKLGATEPRGDLLQHMDDAPRLGAPPTDVP